MNYRGKNVLVTGADGFIGSHLAEELAREGADVTALALYNSFDRFGWLDEIDPGLRAQMRLVRGDIRDGAMMNRVVAGQHTIFHLAALIAIPHSYEAPFSYIDVNVTGTANILEAARNMGVSRIIHTSTSEVYGTAQTVPISETHPIVAQSPYAASKIAADKLAESYALSFGLPVSILRPFNTYGPRQSERAVISTVIRQALDPDCQSIHLGDTSPIRDFNYVGDTVSAFLTIGSNEAIEPGRVYNAGSGSGVTIAALVDLIRSETGTNKPITTDERRIRPQKSEVRELIADSRLFIETTGWRPATTLAQGIAHTVSWWRDRIACGLTRADSSYMV